jgi:hypothetical protein
MSKLLRRVWLVPYAAVRYVQALGDYGSHDERAIIHCTEALRRLWDA